MTKKIIFGQKLIDALGDADGTRLRMYKAKAKIMSVFPKPFNYVEWLISELPEYNTFEGSKTLAAHWNGRGKDETIVQKIENIAESL